MRIPIIFMFVAFLFISISSCLDDKVTSFDSGFEDDIKIDWLKTMDQNIISNDLMKDYGQHTDQNSSNDLDLWCKSGYCKSCTLDKCVVNDLKKTACCPTLDSGNTSKKYCCTGITYAVEVNACNPLNTVCFTFCDTCIPYQWVITN